MIKELTNGEFEDFIKKGFVLIDFFGDWCMPCMIMEPIVEELSEKFKGKINFGKVDVGENPHLAQKFDVTSIPNFSVFKDGKVIKQFIGSRSEEDFEKKLKSLLN